MPWNVATPLTSISTLAGDFHHKRIKPVAAYLNSWLQPLYQPIMTSLEPITKKIYPIINPAFKFSVNFFESAVRLALLINHLFQLAIKSKAISPEAQSITNNYRAFVEISFGLIASVILTYSQEKAKHDQNSSAINETAEQTLLPSSIKDMPGMYKAIRRLLKMAETVYGISTLTEYLSTVLTFILTPTGFYLFTGIAITVGFGRVITDNYKPFLITDPMTIAVEDIQSTEGSTWTLLLKKHFSDYTTESSKTITMFMFTYQYLAGFSSSPSMSLRFTAALFSMLAGGHSFYWAGNRDLKPSEVKDEEHHRASQAREAVTTGTLTAYALSGLDLFFEGLNHADRPEKSGNIPNWLAATFGASGLLVGIYNANKLPRIARAYYLPAPDNNTPINSDTESDEEMEFSLQPEKPPTTLLSPLIATASR